MGVLGHICIVQPMNYTKYAIFDLHQPDSQQRQEQLADTLGGKMGSFMRSLLLLFLLLLAQGDLVNLDHRILVLLVVLRLHTLRGPDYLYDLLELIQLRPLRSIETVAVPQVHVSPVGQQQLHSLLVPKPCGGVERSHPSLVLADGVGTRLQEHLNDLVVVLLHRVVKRSLLAHIEVFLDTFPRTLMLGSPPYLMMILTMLAFSVCTAQWRGVDPLTFCALMLASLSL